MELSGRSVCGAPLFCGLAFPVVGSSQQDESIARVTPPGVSGADISRSPMQNSGPQRCFDAQSAESNTKKELQDVADLPVNYRYWLTEVAAYIIAPEERCAFSKITGKDATGNGFNCLMQLQPLAAIRTTASRNCHLPVACHVEPQLTIDRLY